MELPAGLTPAMLVATLGGVVAVIAIGMGARALFGARRDEVMERLERGPSGGVDTGVVERPSEKTSARLAGLLRPFARLVKPAAGEELSRLNQSLIHAGYRTD